MENYRAVERGEYPAGYLHPFAFPPSLPVFSSLLFRYLSRSPSRGVLRNATREVIPFRSTFANGILGARLSKTSSMLRSNFRFIRLSLCSTTNISPTEFSSAPDIRHRRRDRCPRYIFLDIRLHRAQLFWFSLWSTVLLSRNWSAI